MSKDNKGNSPQDDDRRHSRLLMMVGTQVEDIIDTIHANRKEMMADMRRDCDIPPDATEDEILISILAAVAANSIQRWALVLKTPKGYSFDRLRQLISEANAMSKADADKHGVAPI